MLVDFKKHFAPLRNAVDKKVAEDLIDNGEMADWSETNKGLLTDPANKAEPRCAGRVPRVAIGTPLSDARAEGAGRQGPHDFRDRGARQGKTVGQLRRLPFDRGRRRKEGRGERQLGPVARGLRKRRLAQAVRRRPGPSRKLRRTQSHAGLQGPSQRSRVQSARALADGRLLPAARDKDRRG